MVTPPATVRHKPRSATVSMQSDQDEQNSGYSPTSPASSREAQVDAVAHRRALRGTFRQDSWDEDWKKVSSEIKFENNLRTIETVREMLNCSNDLSEIYSPPRIASTANRMGMRGGFSLDFTTPEADGYVWDFNKVECRNKAMKLVKRTKPYMLVGSPECTPFSTIQNLNMRTPAGYDKVMAERAQGEVHLEFCRQLYMEQVRGGRYFLH